MCIREFISYQCGHRSPPVLGTCPLTTEGHNLPVCDKRPDKPTYAETMCTACERALHSRWVLVREWEHRWLHTRGACGCEVVFHGVLNTPQVSGGDMVDPKETKNVPLTITDGSAVGTSSGGAVRADVTERAKGKQKEKATTSTNIAQGGSAPPLYNEIITTEGESHVQLRLKSLYAGEWRADHRALHEAGKCNCRAIFAPFKPLIPDEELTADDWKLVQWWREQEKAFHGQDDEARRHRSDVENEEEAISRRMKEIDELFGSFDIKGHDGGMAQSRKPSIKLPHSSVALLPPNTTVTESSEQGHRRMGRRHAQNRSQPAFSRRSSHDNRRGGKDRKDRVRDRSQTNPLPRQPAVSEQQGQYTIHGPEYPGQPSQNIPVAPPPTPITQQGWIYDPFTNQMTLQHIQPHNVPLQSMGYFPAASGSYQQASPSPYPPRLPQLPQVAHPAFATMATYTNTTPIGACPWSQQHAQSHRKSRSGGPYHAAGLDYSSFDNPDKADDIGVPICGIPIGGEAHMPDWRDCHLRKSSHPALQEQSAVESGTEIGGVNANPGLVVEYTHGSDSKSDTGYEAATDESAVVDGELLGAVTSPSSQRRHSAAI
ncbi:hypothetical protein B0T21DRAFT_291746 [Apiosordaria backusii]|uniref:Uncharacterized protein n=1 Tax=Apiosordaria backusii TaxID=314023 RepID=A0AA40B7P3_9PEZI|nr:hypothetical protein B0T21DRAFT_291746 [Apiosordaria backusii]